MGKPLRNIAKRVSISPAALFRHKPHVARAVVKAAEGQEEKRGLDLLEEAERVRHKALELLGKLEAEGDYRGAIVAVREARECLDTLGKLLTGADGVSLAGIPDAAILEEAKRRGLRMPVNIRVVYDDPPDTQSVGARG